MPQPALTNKLSCPSATNLPRPSLALTWSQKYKQMQEQGVRADDPEFQRAHQLLSMIQRQQAFAKQQRMAQQQVQQQRPQQTNGGAAPEAVATNGAHGEFFLSVIRIAE